MHKYLMVVAAAMIHDETSKSRRWKRNDGVSDRSGRLMTQNYFRFLVLNVKSTSNIFYYYYSQEVFEEEQSWNDEVNQKTKRKMEL